MYVAPSIDYDRQYDNNPRPNGVPMPASWISGSFGKMLEDVGLPRIGFHDLRHSAATNMHQLSVIHTALSSSVFFEDFSGKLLQQGVTVKESRGRLSYLTLDRTKPITARKLGNDFDRTAVLKALTSSCLIIASHLLFRKK